VLPETLEYVAPGMVMELIPTSSVATTDIVTVAVWAVVVNVTEDGDAEMLDIAGD